MKLSELAEQLRLAYLEACDANPAGGPERWNSVAARAMVLLGHLQEYKRPSGESGTFATATPVTFTPEEQELLGLTDGEPVPALELGEIAAAGEGGGA